MYELSTAQRFALNEWLSDYPDGPSYDELLSMIEAGSDEIAVWVVAQDYPGYQVAEMVEGTRQHFHNVTRGWLPA